MGIFESSILLMLFAINVRLTWSKAGSFSIILASFLAPTILDR
jgi:hypothetical protein